MELAREIESVVGKKKGKSSKKTAYETLSDIFPLIPLKIKTKHKLALEVSEKILKYLIIREDLNKLLREEIQNYLSTLSMLIEDYETKNIENMALKLSGVDMLKYLIKENGLNQDDFKKEIGSQSIVSNLLNGKKGRKISTYAKALGRRFKVSPALFID